MHKASKSTQGAAAFLAVCSGAAQVRSPRYVKSLGNEVPSHIQAPKLVLTAATWLHMDWKAGVFLVRLEESEQEE